MSTGPAYRPPVMGRIVMAVSVSLDGYMQGPGHELTGTRTCGDGVVQLRYVPR